jgi:hypothetical protein
MPLELSIMLLENIYSTGVTHDDCHIMIVMCGLYYKHVTTVNDDSSITNKGIFQLIGNARVVIYDHNRFIIQATGHSSARNKLEHLSQTRFCNFV